MTGRGLAVVVALALVLAGCSTATPAGGTGGNGGSGGTGGRPGSSDEEVIGTDTEVSDGTGIDSDSGRLPSGWPDDVIVPEGEIVQGVTMGDSGWLALIDAPDPLAAFAESSASLQAAGYTVVSEAIGEHGSVGIYENAQLQVQVAVADAADSGWTMSYTITKKG